MKIKKINIQAFRLFHEETVHLSSKKDTSKPANFVAIYAPNGFGKTSFFDAMEFCMTGNIHRLADNFTENAGEDRKQSGGKSFIHNKDYPDTDVSITMEFNDREPKTRTCRPDEEYQLLEGSGENSYFSEAILSQDFFSAFISDKNAKQRFEIFTQRFKETNGLLDYRQWLKTESNSLGKQIGKIEKDVQSRKEEINKALNDIDIKPMIKEVIDAMKSVGHDIRIQDCIPDIKVEEHRLQASIWIEECQKSYEEKEKRHSWFLNLINGSEEVISIYELLPIEEEINASKEESEAYHKLLADICKYNEYKELIAKTTSTLQNLKQELEKVEYLIRHYDEYEKKRERINLLNMQLSKDKGTIEILQSRRTVLEDQSKELGIVFDKLEERRVKIDESLSGLSERYKQMRTYALDIEEKTKELILLEDDKDEKEKEHKKHIEQITALHELLDKCNQRKVDLTNGLYFDERKEIVELANKVSSRETELSKVNESIKEKRKYLEDIDQLIAKSREMVSQIEGGVCPLCGFDYKSHNALLQSISSNTVINESLEKDVQTKESIETEIRQLSSSIETKYAVLIGEIEDQIDQCRSNLLSISQVIKERSEQIKQLSSLIQEKENRISLNFKDISNIPEEKKRELLENQKAQLDNEYKKNEAEKNQNKSDLEAIECQLKATSEKIENATKEISEAKTDELYLLMTAYSTAHSLSEIDKDYIINAADNIHKDIEKQENALMTYNNVVAQITVNPEQEEFVTAKQKEAEAKLGKASLLRSKIITTIEKNCKIDDLDKQTAKTIIEKFEDEFALLKKDIKEIEKEIATISRYTDILNLIDKIRFNEKLQDEISYRTKRKKELCDYKEACVKEISDIEQYLKKFVTGYFELDLINRLYNTIDPHPDYKQVKFECDFKNKNPRLKVLLNNIEDGKESIVPNLYFSTAQINILSFCIFLAKALFTKDSEGRSLDCIFIDDPIQALDEINILSIIDLLRNVAFSMDKQIVLTTHDRNFFELLQKKVPDNLFDSRFITLPERGKFNYL